MGSLADPERVKCSVMLSDSGPRSGSQPQLQFHGERFSVSLSSESGKNDLHIAFPVMVMVLHHEILTLEELGVLKFLHPDPSPLSPGDSNRVVHNPVSVTAHSHPDRFFPCLGS